MNPNLGPLFEGPPAAHGIPWLHIFPLLVAVPAATILIVGLINGRPSPALGVAAVILTLASYGLGCLLVLEDSKHVEFCGSCHVMTPIAASLRKDDGSLASLHYARGLVPHDQACYICHSGYGVWGTVGAKVAGFGHMLRTVTGRYDLPIELNGPFDIDSCLGCHSYAPRFRAVEAHQAPDLQKVLVSREMSCTGACHPAAHPAEALHGSRTAS